MVIIKYSEGQVGEVVVPKEDDKEELNKKLSEMEQNDEIKKEGQDTPFWLQK